MEKTTEDTLSREPDTPNEAPDDLPTGQTEQAQESKSLRERLLERAVTIEVAPPPEAATEPAATPEREAAEESAEADTSAASTPPEQETTQPPPADPILAKLAELGVKHDYKTGEEALKGFAELRSKIGQLGQEAAAWRQLAPVLPHFQAWLQQQQAAQAQPSAPPEEPASWLDFRPPVDGAEWGHRTCMIREGEDGNRQYVTVDGTPLNEEQAARYERWLAYRNSWWDQHLSNPAKFFERATPYIKAVAELAMEEAQQRAAQQQAVEQTRQQVRAFVEAHKGELFSGEGQLSPLGLKFLELGQKYVQSGYRVPLEPVLAEARQAMDQEAKQKGAAKPPSPNASTAMPRRVPRHQQTAKVSHPGMSFRERLIANARAEGFLSEDEQT